MLPPMIQPNPGSVSAQIAPATPAIKAPLFLLRGKISHK
jgi:hypothetical protein